MNSLLCFIRDKRIYVKSIILLWVTGLPIEKINLLYKNAITDLILNNINLLSFRYATDICFKYINQFVKNNNEFMYLRHKSIL